jgi:hypothetical protein
VVFSQPKRPVVIRPVTCPNATTVDALLRPEKVRWRVDELAAVLNASHERRMRAAWSEHPNATHERRVRDGGHEHRSEHLPRHKAGEHAGIRGIHSCGGDRPAIAHDACEAAHASEGMGTYVASNLGTGFESGSRKTPLLDETRQRGYYDAPKLHELIDVGLLWSPTNQLGNAFAVANRPPTRMAWWWSHGVPTIGYPMQAYVEGSRRAGYPTTLLNLTNAIDVQRALCAIADQRTRRCLRSSALRGAALTSPQYSARELVAAVCIVVEACSRPGGRADTHDSPTGVITSIL